MTYMDVPAQPAEWAFIDELKAPVKKQIYWERNTSQNNEADIKKDGCYIIKNFPDSEKVLDTAYKDLESFLKEARIPESKNGFKIITQKENLGELEKYIINIDSDSCTIISGDTEGIRRAIFYIEDLLLSSSGPFLEKGLIEKESWCKTRISRCFFGPINRPPLNRDELLDDVNYYPDEYLNRLAHEGINGLWLTTIFRDLCKTSLYSGHAPDAEKRFAKLNRTIEKCKKYGIKIYVLCIEPEAFEECDQLLNLYPELGGVKRHGVTMFCPFSDIAQRYLSEAVKIIFTKAPGLGGMINISIGEGATTCISAVDETGHSNCPICGSKEAWEIHYASLAAMERGMHESAPEAKLISWLYVPLNCIQYTYDFISDIAKHVPKNVILQYNFESGGQKIQLNKPRFAGDYWLSYCGPSDIFQDIAKACAAKSSQVSAKLQVGCSHEVASIPFVPVPAQLYKKYRAMYELGVSSVMQCWYFGNYPGIMNKAAGMLAFEDFSRSETEFLESLAKIEWGKHYKELASAWKYFSSAYENYPVNVLFQYYGPMHDGPVWPLHLKPVDTPLSPTWRLDYPPSGDRIGECLGVSHTLAEAVILCRNMAEDWEKGVNILKNFSGISQESSERLRNITLAEALAIQFRSGYNILKFYNFRNELIDSDSIQRLIILDKIKKIVEKEIILSERLAELCEADPRLGFHPEAEGYKYFPSKLKWRCDLLRFLLKKDFPEVEQSIRKGEPLFKEFSNDAFSDGKKYECGCRQIEQLGNLSWSADVKDNNIIIEISASQAGKLEKMKMDNIYVLFEYARFNPISFFGIDKNGDWGYNLMKDPEKNCSCAIKKTKKGFNLTLEISLNAFPVKNMKQLRFNVLRDTEDLMGNKNTYAWVKMNPLKPRLIFKNFNSHDMGILKINKK